MGISFKEVEVGNEKIGIEINSEHQYTILIPKYFLNNRELGNINKEVKDKIKKLFKAWNIYQKRNQGELGAEFSDGETLYDINNSLEIIKDFIEYGLYIEQENTTKITNTGKMNFKKTIDTCNPLYTDQGPIYLDYLTDTKKPNDQNFLRMVQTTVINEISEDFGWIIGFNFKFPTSEKIQLNKKTQIMLHQKLNESFNSRKINLIKLLIKYIDMNSKGLVEGKKLFIAMANHFWEDMVNYVVGNVSKRELDYYFYVRHIYIEGDKIIQPLSALRPDSVYKKGKNLIVIDAKYYLNNNLPENKDINKQIIYMLKAYKTMQEYDNFGNCFIIPTDKESEFSDKIIKFDEKVDDKLLSINLIYANLSEMVDHYIKLEKNYELIKDLIILD